MAVDSSIEQIKDRVSIADVVGQRVTLRKTGRNYVGLCPFHAEKTPSFVVSTERGSYHCFGCGQGGDIFTFVMQTENLGFGDALRMLAEKAGVTLRERHESPEDSAARQRLFDANATTATFYHNLLRQTGGKMALDYLHGREISDATIDQYELGWAPDSSDTLRRHLVSRGFTTEEAVAAGLALEREGSTTRDTFRRRVVFPIRDQRGHILGFGGRAMGEDQPKYLNTPATSIFDKSGVLYGLEVAHTAIRRAESAIVVEGYVDALMAHQHCFRNVVAALGTALTERQLGALKRLTKRLILAMDPDAAGQSATMRGLETARQVFGEAVPTVGPGLVRLEQRVGADLRVALLPPGKDPDALIRSDVDAWKQAIDGARPLVEFYFDVVLRKADLTTAGGTSDAVHQLLPIVGELADSVQRSFYLRRLSQETGIQEQVLAAELRRGGQRRRPPATREGPRAAERLPSRPGAVLDEYYIELLLAEARVTGKLEAELTADELGSTQARVALTWLQSASAAGADLRSATLIDDAQVDDEIRQWLSLRAAGGHGAKRLDDLELQSERKHCIREIRRRNLRWRTEDLSELMTQPDEGESQPDPRKRFAEATESLLTELQPYEIDPARHGVWRSPRRRQRLPETPKSES